MIGLISIIALSALINRIRGGGFDEYLPEGWNDNVAAVLYGALTGAVAGDILIAVGFAAAFRLGEAPAWGHWVGVVIGDHKNRVEKSPIDWLLRGIKDVDVWAVAGLTIRGIFWGAVLALPAYFLYWQMAVMYLILGAFMGGAYMVTRAAPVRTGMRWAMAEYIVGSLWGLPLTYINILA